MACGWSVFVRAGWRRAPAVEARPRAAADGSAGTTRKTCDGARIGMEGMLGRSRRTGPVAAIIVRGGAESSRSRTYQGAADAPYRV